MALRSDGVPNCTVAVEAKQSSLDTDIREPCYKPSELWLALPSELKHGRGLLSAFLGIHVHRGKSYNPGKGSGSPALSENGQELHAIYSYRVGGCWGQAEPPL